MIRGQSLVTDEAERSRRIETVPVSKRNILSLTIALMAEDGLVLAADSRATEGYTLNGPKTTDDSIKFIQLKDDIGVLTYGFSEIGYSGITCLREEVERYDSLTSILDKSIQLFSNTSSDWGKKNPEVKRRDKDVGFIVAGYDREGQGYKIFNSQSPEFLPQEVKSGCLMAGQWHVAKFFINRLYARDMTVNLVRELAVFLLSATMTVEKTVGGVIRLATITKPKGFQWISEDEVDSIAKRNKEFYKFFQQRFYSILLDLAGGDNQ
ncbi:MAG: hypothetical protein ACE5IH_10090 [Thermodesulfobacteriota bacterium]